MCTALDRAPEGFIHTIHVNAVGTLYDSDSDWDGVFGSTLPSCITAVADNTRRGAHPHAGGFRTAALVLIRRTLIIVDRLLIRHAYTFNTDQQVDQNEH